jgi:hypothetical protein
MRVGERMLYKARAVDPRIRDLCVMAVNGLVPMLDPDKQLFCYRLNRTSAGLVREGLSHRYTAMCLLGLDRLRSSGQVTSPFDTKNIFTALVADLGWVDNIGDVGLLMWLCATTEPQRLEQVYTELSVRTALDRFEGAQVGITMELAWFLSGLAHASLGGHVLPDLPALSARAFALLISNQGAAGFFGHQGTRRSLMGYLRGRIGSFADQVYPIYALAQFSEAFQDRSALASAAKCAEAICRAQGPQGQWWWHYDAITNRVFRRYPVYSVHQHGMAPLALFALAEVGDLDFNDAIYKGLSWIYGQQELGLDMRETSSNLIWRSVYRRNVARTYAMELMEFLKGDHSPLRAGDLTIKFECRPYELGWLLFAFGARAAS